MLAGLYNGVSLVNNTAGNLIDLLALPDMAAREVLGIDLAELQLMAQQTPFPHDDMIVGVPLLAAKVPGTLRAASRINLRPIVASAGAKLSGVWNKVTSLGRTKAPTPATINAATPKTGAGRIANPKAFLPPREVGNFIGTPQQVVLSEGEIIYGIREVGSRRVWWTRTKPLGELQWRMDQAVLPQWNAGTHIETLVIPRGQSLIGFEGATRGQSWFLGGGNQLYIPDVPEMWSILEMWK